MAVLTCALQHCEAPTDIASDVDEIRLQGLDFESDYRFKVYAHTSAGQGPPNSADARTLPEALRLNRKYPTDPKRLLRFVNYFSELGVFMLKRAVDCPCLSFLAHSAGSRRPSNLAFPRLFVRTGLECSFVALTSRPKMGSHLEGI